MPQIERYMAKISGPLLDRIDLHIEVPAVPFKELSGSQDGTSSRPMREQVMAARAVQALASPSSRTRHKRPDDNSRNPPALPAQRRGHESARQSIQEMGLSARAHDKILRVARTIADLDGSHDINAEHVSEAVNYRMLDRQFWS